MGHTDAEYPVCNNAFTTASTFEVAAKEKPLDLERQLIKRKEKSSHIKIIL